jgi:hypothetical protein
LGNRYVTLNGIVKANMSVGELISYLRYVCLFAHSVVQRILCCVFALLSFKETGNIECIKRRKTKEKYDNICFGHHCTSASINNINKKYALLHTTGGKDEPNIVFVQRSQWTVQLRNLFLIMNINLKYYSLRRSTTINHSIMTFEVCLNYASCSNK